MYIMIGITAFAVITTALIYYNTIITRKWRDKVPNEQNNWRLGFIYYNPDDSRLILPKRTGLGITFNFARPASIVITVAILLIIAIYIAASA